MGARHFGQTALFALFAVTCSASCGLFGSDDQPQPGSVPQPVPETGPDPQPVGPKHETGNCRNEHVEGMCHFVVASRAPGQSADDPSGTTQYRLMHQVEVKGEDRKIELVTANLLVPDDKVEELREYYRKNSPTPCKAYIVRPPCNPLATSVSLGVGPPEYAKPVRF
jgi:hypothetical protein